MKTGLIILVAIIFMLSASWLIQGKPEKQVSLKLRLFPNWFKKLGLIWILLSFVVSFIFKLWGDGPNYFIVNSMNLGLFMICFAKDKVEDEMTNQIRLKAFYYSVIGAFSSAIFLSLLEFFMEEGEFSVEAYSLIALILIIYLITFNRVKSSVRV